MLDKSAEKQKVTASLLKTILGIYLRNIFE